MTEQAQRLERLRKIKRLQELKALKGGAVPTSGPPAVSAGPAIPERGSPEYEARRAELLKGQSEAQAQSDKAGRRIKGLNKTLGVANSVNRFANAATLHVPDRIASTAQSGFDKVVGNEGRDRHQELKTVKEAVRQQFPKSSLASDIGGSIAGASKIAGAGGTALKFAKNKGLLATSAALAADGAAFAGADALVDGRDVSKEARNGGIGGAIANVAARGAGAGVSKLFKGKVPAVPSTQDLLDGATRTRNQIQELGVRYSPEQVRQLAQGAQDDISITGIDAVGGKVGKTVKRLVKNADKGATFEQLDKLRKQIDLPVTASNSDKRLAGLLRGHIDDFSARIDPEQGSREGLSDLLAASRDFTKRGRTAEALEQALETATSRTKQSGTGGNFDNNLRQEIGKVINKQGKFLPQEILDDLEKVRRGSKKQNLSRLVGRGLSPDTGALNLLATGAATVATGGSNLLPQAGGFLLKKGSERTSRKGIERIIRELQAGSKQAAARPETRISKAAADKKVQETIARALLGASLTY